MYLDAFQLPSWIQSWACRRPCCLSSGQGSFFPSQTLNLEASLCVWGVKKSSVKQGGVTSGKGSGALLTRGVVGHICAHRVRSWAPLVHHSVHAVHARAVWGACSHHALGHVRVARWPKEKAACLILTEVLQLHQADLSNRPKGSGRVILILSSPCSAAALTILLCLFCIKRSIYVIIQQFQPTSASL